MEDLLVKAALVVMFIGLAVLFFLTKSISPVTGAVEDTETGNDVLVNGRVSNILTHKKLRVLTIVQPKPVDVVLFEDPQVQIEKGQIVRVEGRVSEFNGKNQILAYKIDVSN